MLSPGLNTLRLESRLVCPLPAFAIIPASLVLDGYADTFQRLHEESACVLRSMLENLPHPYYSINHKIFSGSEQNIQLPQKDSKYSFLPKVAVFKGFRGHPMFALMPCNSNYFRQIKGTIFLKN